MKYIFLLILLLVCGFSYSQENSLPSEKYKVQGQVTNYSFDLQKKLLAQNHSYRSPWENYLAAGMLVGTYVTGDIAGDTMPVYQRPVLAGTCFFTIVTIFLVIKYIKSKRRKPVFHF